MPTILRVLLSERSERHALGLLVVAVLCLVAGGAVFSVTQHIPVTTGWYWAVTTATTVGYGDVTAHNASGRLVASVVMLTTIPLLAAAFALFTGSTVAKGIRRVLHMAVSFPSGPFRLVLGMQPAVAVALDELGDARASVVLVADVEPETVPHHVFLVRGDPTAEATLRTAKPADAVHVLVACPDDGDAMLAAALVHNEAPDVPLTVLVGSPRLKPALHDLGVEQVLSPDDLAGHALAKALEAPRAGDLLVHLIRGEHHRITEQVVDDAAGSRRLSEIRASCRQLVLGVVQGGAVSLGIGDDDPDVRPGDVLLLVEPNGEREQHR